MSKFTGELIVTPYKSTAQPDGKNWRLVQDVAFRSDLIGLIVVAAGFITDFASTPAAIWNIIPPWGVYGPAAVVHDWLYWTQPCTRTAADYVLREAMIDLQVREDLIQTIYDGVRVGGQHSWDRDAVNRAAGKEHAN